MRFDGRFVWNKTEQQMLAERGLEPGGEVQKCIDAAVIRYCEPYVPHDSGALAGSVNADDVGSGEVIYNTPYAHYMYYGEVYGPNIPIFQAGEVVGFRSPPGKGIKEPTGAKLQYNTEYSALSGSFWFERMKADHREDILNEAIEVAGGKHN